MRSRSRWIVGLVAGFVMGVVFVVACGGRRGGGGDGPFDAGRDAHAQAEPCAHWQVVSMNLSGTAVGEVDGEPIYAAPAGWEPFALSAPVYVLRRCAD